MKTSHRIHSARRIPAPTAPIGSLLELVQLGRHQAARTTGGSAPQAEAYDLCIAAAAAHPELLAATPGRDGLRAFVLNCTTPWEGLWRQIAPVIGVSIEPPQRNSRACAQVTPTANHSASN